MTSCQQQLCGESPSVSLDPFVFVTVGTERRRSRDGVHVWHRNDCQPSSGRSVLKRPGRSCCLCVANSDAHVDEGRHQFLMPPYHPLVFSGSEAGTVSEGGGQWRSIGRFRRDGLLPATNTNAMIHTNALFKKKHISFLIVAFQHNRIDVKRNQPADISFKIRL